MTKHIGLNCLKLESANDCNDKAQRAEFFNVRKIEDICIDKAQWAEFLMLES